MKKLIILIIICLAFSPSKDYKLTDGQGAMVYQTLETAKKTIPSSEAISAKEATTALLAIDSIQKVIYRQYADSTRNNKIN